MLNYPVGVIFDFNASGFDGVFGTDSSDRSNCETDGVAVVLDNLKS